MTAFLDNTETHDVFCNHPVFEDYLISCTHQIIRTNSPSTSRKSSNFVMDDMFVGIEEQELRILQVDVVVLENFVHLNTESSGLYVLPIATFVLLLLLWTSVAFQFLRVQYTKLAVVGPSSRAIAP